MKLCIILLLFTSNDIIGQPMLTGKVIDRILKTPIKGATVYLNIEDYTNADTVLSITADGKDTMVQQPEYICIDSMVTNSSGVFPSTSLKEPNIISKVI